MIITESDNSLQYSAAGDAFDTTRKAGWITGSLAAGARCWRRRDRAGEGV